MARLLARSAPWTSPRKIAKKKRPRPGFMPEFKAETVRLCRVSDRSIAWVTKDLDLTATALREWVPYVSMMMRHSPSLQTIWATESVLHAEGPVFQA